MLSGCVAGSIDPGDPVDYALACGGTSSSPAAVASSQFEGPLVLGERVPGLTAVPTTQGGVYGSYVPVAVDPAMPIFAPTVQRILYLNREGATLTAGPDNAAANTSSVLGGGPPK